MQAREDGVAKRSLREAPGVCKDLLLEMRGESSSVLPVPKFV